MPNDIFISYRRKGGWETAKHLRDLLVHDGYTVSFDMDTLRSGPFPENLFKLVDECTDFILILDKGVFDKTMDPQVDKKYDWLRNELAYALEKGKNIVPIRLQGFNEFPRDLPADIAAVEEQNGPEHNTVYFDAFYERLKRKFLKSKKSPTSPPSLPPAIPSFAPPIPNNAHPSPHHFAPPLPQAGSVAQNGGVPNNNLSNPWKNCVVTGCLIPLVVMGLIAFLGWYKRDDISFFMDMLTNDSPKPDAPGRYLITDTDIAMLPIPAGSFLRGGVETEAEEDEEPVRNVKITKTFWLGQHPVTQAQYKKLTEKNPSKFKEAGADAPVENVSWNDAMAFCEKLNERERAAGRLPVGYKYTLPTEAQWEYACRAETTTLYAGSDLDAMGWYSKNSEAKTQRVGKKDANAWGLLDMHGNVWEWCSDWYRPDYYENSPLRDPSGPKTGVDRVLRGGAWNSPALDCRSSRRKQRKPEAHDNTTGFRIAVVAVPEEQPDKR